MSAASVQLAERLQRFVRGLKKRDELNGFFKVLNESGEAFLFGGAPRDVAFGAIDKVNDLDIFVSGHIDLDAINQFSSFVRYTNFGGLRLFVGKFEVDAWELDKSYAFRANADKFIGARSLLNSVCFSTDGIAVSLKTGRVTSTPAFKASLDHHCLDFVVPPAKIEAVIGARIARLALKLDLELTTEVAYYFSHCLDKYHANGLIDAEARWGHRRVLNEIVLEQIKTHIWRKKLRLATSKSDRGTF